jgi:MFS family permease
VRRAPLVALYVADAISLSGNAVAQLAIPWYVLVTTGSPALTGLTVFFTFLPVVLAGLLGGVVVDRLGFRTSSIVADLASSGAVAAIPALHATVGIELWQLMALVFAGALLDAPGATARSALLPDLAELAGVRLERATGIRGAIQRGSLLVGAPLGGVLVAGFGATTALWLDAASFLVSASLVAFVVPAARGRRAGEASPRGYRAELAEGLAFIWRHRLIRAIVATVLVTNFLDAPIGVVMPVFARESFGSAADLGLMFGVFGGFALVGSLAFGAAGHRLPRRPVFVTCFFVWACDYLVLATLPSLPVTLVALAVGGLAIGPVNPLLGTLGFERVPAELRGRVVGATTAGAWAAIPLGVLLGGVAVDVLGVAATFLTIGICYVAVTAFGFFNPAFREMDRPPAPDVRDGASVSGAPGCYSETPASPVSARTRCPRG